jgi:hypothetical protein
MPEINTGAAASGASGSFRLCVEMSTQVAAKKYPFISRSGSTLKILVFKARSPRMNVGFFNRDHKMLR